MIKKAILGLGLGLGITMLGIAVAAPNADKSSQKFIKDAIEGNLAEVQMGKLAQDKSMDDGVRSFGDMLVKDHSAGNEKATEVANAIGVTPPTEPSSKQKAMYDKMQWSYMDPNGEISFDGLRDQQDWYAKRGFVATKANVEAMTDRRFLDYALDKIGRVDDK